ncbi:MAG: hypothetical protein C4529_10835 [Deltaproteobacteria bacterium]|nr:MAG: hypothetical protein C4529_10835 [Deltaproteobacteria bacterium]
MRSPLPGFLAALSMICLVAVSPAGAQLTGIDDLCRLHGVEDADSIGKIRKAYLEAMATGIPEEVLFPFVEDVLRHKLNCGQMVRVLDVTARLRKADLPYFVVFSKVREGVAKEAPPARVVDAAEAKFKTLSESRDVLKSLGSLGYSVRDPQNAAVVVSSYIERGYAPAEIVTQIRNKGIEGGGFAALSGVVENPVKRKAH